MLLGIASHKRKVLSKQCIYLNSVPFPSSGLNQILSYIPCKVFLDSVSKRHEFRPDPSSWRVSKPENFAVSSKIESSFYPYLVLSVVFVLGISILCLANWKKRKKESINGKEVPNE